jgi:hypothetical protein
MVKYCMHNQRYLQEVALELENLTMLIQELQKIINTQELNDPDIVLKTATSSFMAQYYTGIENILKRISKYFSVPLPKSDSWHYELFSSFCNPSTSPLPVLFSDDIKNEMNELRKFRHRFHHGYSFTLEWNELLIGAKTVTQTFELFALSVNSFLQKSTKSNS